MSSINLKAEKRTVAGRRVKLLRKQGLLPGNVYGNKQESQNIQVTLDDFKRVYNEAGETGLIELKIGSGQKHVLISNLQLDPVSDKPLHVDFREVNLREKITATVPVELDGEAPAEKSGVGTPVQQLSEIEVEALPTDLPESFLVDISNLIEVDQAIYVKDLQVDTTKVEILADLEAIVVKIEPPQEEEAVEAPQAPEGEAAVEPSEQTAEGETEASEEKSEE